MIVDYCTITILNICTDERSYVDNWGKIIQFPSSIKYSSNVRSSHEKICIVEKQRKYAKLHAFLIINITKILMKKCKMHDFIEWHWFYEVGRTRGIWRKMNNAQRMSQSMKVPIEYSILPKIELSEIRNKSHNRYI